MPDARSPIPDSRFNRFHSSAAGVQLDKRDYHYKIAQKGSQRNAIQWNAMERSSAKPVRMAAAASLTVHLELLSMRLQQQQEQLLPRFNYKETREACELGLGGPLSSRPLERVGGASYAAAATSNINPLRKELAGERRKETATTITLAGISARSQLATRSLRSQCTELALNAIFVSIFCPLSFAGRAFGPAARSTPGSQRSLRASQRASWLGAQQVTGL